MLPMAKNVQNILLSIPTEIVEHLDALVSHSQNDKPVTQELLDAGVKRASSKHTYAKCTDIIRQWRTTLPEAVPQSQRVSRRSLIITLLAKALSSAEAPQQGYSIIEAEAIIRMAYSKAHSTK